MDAKKVARSVVTATIVIGSFAAGQQLGKTSPEVRVVSMGGDPVPWASVSVQTDAGPHRHRIACPEKPEIDGKASTEVSVASVCGALWSATKAVDAAVKNVSFH